MSLNRRNSRICVPVWLLALGCLLAGVSNGSVAYSQTPDGETGRCDQIPALYQLANYTVKQITAEPMVKFIGASAVIDDALAAAIAKQVPGSKGLSVGQRFDTAGVSFLEDALNNELELRILRGRMGLLYLQHKLINCDDSNRTLEVQYQVLIVARPSYLRNSFEAQDRREKNKEAAGTLKGSEKSHSLVPFAGYNRSRAMYGGAELVIDSDYKPLNKLALSASGSSSSAVVQASASGFKNFNKGPLSFAEWRAGYGYSNIPTDGFDLKEATAAARFFAASRPISSHNLIFRFGTSVEGGNRQTSLPQSAALPSTIVDSGYGALKLYAGASLTTRRQDFKASYGLQLGNTGEDLGVDYRKQIFDSAYRLRFLPKPFKPFQLDAQFSAGSLSSVSGPVPYGERFFGGNVEEEFIQNDSWKIRSNPVIRSFPQNRLNGGSGLLPLGGDNFVSINLTAAQTIWQKRLIPGEISEDPDLTLALGTQLLTARIVFREEAVRASRAMKELEQQVGCADPDPPDPEKGRHCLTPVVNRLKTLLEKLLLQAGSDDDLKQAINSFSDDDGSNWIGKVEQTISGAKLVPEADRPVVEDQASAINNPVEGAVFTLIHDDFSDPDTPAPSLLTIVQTHIKTLQDRLTAPVFAKSKTELQEINDGIDRGRKALQSGRETVDQLRAYNLEDVQDVRTALDRTAGQGKKLDDLLADIKALLKPEREGVQARIKELDQQLSQMSDTDPQTAEVKKRRNTLSEYRDLLEAAESYREKAGGSVAEIRKSFAHDPPDYEGVKIYAERLTAGFGGLLSYLSGLDIKIKEAEQLLREQGMPALPAQIDADVADVRLIHRGLRSAFNKVNIPPAEVTANQTVNYVGRILGIFFRETNIVAVSPVVMFDAARLRVNNLPDTDRFRYGIGSGIRFSLINVDFTAGYSFNPNRHLNEPRGAFVFRMDINDLFK